MAAKRGEGEEEHGSRKTRAVSAERSIRRWCSATVFTVFIAISETRRRPVVPVDGETTPVGGSSSSSPPPPPLFVLTLANGGGGDGGGLSSETASLDVVAILTYVSRSGHTAKCFVAILDVRQVRRWRDACGKRRAFRVSRFFFPRERVLAISPAACGDVTDLQDGRVPRLPTKNVYHPRIASRCIVLSSSFFVVSLGRQH